jgi:hypothetical protein
MCHSIAPSEFSGQPTDDDGCNDHGVIGRLHQVVIDCPDPAGVAFQVAPDHQPPQWPDPNRPQQVHLDVMVDDQAAAEARVIELGARPLAGGDHVYADPAGHPFCLIPRPTWAAPINADRP